MRFAIIAMMLALTGVSCGSPTTPTPPTPPPPTMVMAPPPDGVSNEVWRIGFGSDGLLRRPDAVHLDMSDFDSSIQSVFAEMLVVAADIVQQKTSLDMIPGGIGATFKVALNPGLVCGDYGRTAGCTTLRYEDSVGRVTGGKMEFVSVTIMQNKTVVLHEIIRTLGVIGNSPVSGLMSQTPWSSARPTEEERLMLLGRYNYPLLAQYQGR